jgi:CRISPR/Cas system-associated exonuclease Cas4 (RecB family)
MEAIDILTIDKEIQDDFLKEEKELSNYIAKKNTLQKLLNENKGISNSIKLNLQEELKKINDLIKKGSELEEYYFYLMDTAQLIDKYKQLLSKPMKVTFFGKPKQSEHTNEKNELTKLYLEKIKKYYSVHIPPEEIKQKSCQNCDFKNIINIIDTKTTVCVNCGLQTELTSDSSSFKDSTRVNLSSKYTYESRIHFRDCMNQYQGKQNTTIPDVVFKNLEKQFELHGLLEGDAHSPTNTRFSKITREHLYLFLRETGHSTHYEDVFMIHYKLTGKKPNDISHLEQQLMEDFDILINLYDKKFKQNRKIERKSFINTQYVLFQLLRRHRYMCKKEDFNMLKTLDRKSFHDDICKELFEELGWNFTPTF